MKKKYLTICLVMVFIIFELTLLFPVTAHSQELTEAQRQERCQDTKNRIAALEAQSKIMDGELSNNSQREMDDNKYHLEFVRFYKTYLTRYMMDNETTGPGKELLFAIAWKNNVDAYKCDKGGDALLNCAMELEKILSNKIDKAVSLQNKKPELINNKKESQKKIDDDKYYLNFVRVYKTFVMRYMMDNGTIEPDKELLFAIAWKNNVDAYKCDKGGDALLNCAIELEKILAKKIDKTKSSQNNKPELINKKAEIEKQLAQYRSNLIALRCDEEGADQWNGTFTNANFTFNFSGNSTSVSAEWTYTAGDSKGTCSLKSSKIEGSKATGTWTAQHEDDTKKGSRSGTFTFTFNGNTVTGQLVEDTPTWSYKAGYSAANVNSSMHKGSVWAINITRKK